MSRDEPSDSAPRWGSCSVTGRFLKQGEFENFASALIALKDWLVRANASGYASDRLAAWVTVSDKVRVQLATRSYWRKLTPRGPARDALAESDASDCLRCLVFRRGQVVSALLDELATGARAVEGAEGPHLKPNPVSGAA